MPAQFYIPLAEPLGFDSRRLRERSVADLTS